MEWPDYTAPPPVLPRRSHHERSRQPFRPSQQQLYLLDDNGLLVPAGPSSYEDPYGLSYNDNLYGQAPSDPLAPYTLPVGRPHVASRHRNPVRGQRPAQVVINSRSNDYERRPQQRSYTDIQEISGGRDFGDDDGGTDVESDISEAVSGDSFTFSSSELENGEKHMNDPTSISAESLAPATLMNGNKPEKPSPYAAAELYVQHSRYLGDPLELSDCMTTLIGCQPPVNPKQQNQGLFSWMCVSMIDHEYGMLISSVTSRVNTKVFLLL